MHQDSRGGHRQDMRRGAGPSRHPVDTGLGVGDTEILKGDGAVRGRAKDRHRPDAVGAKSGHLHTLCARGEVHGEADRGVRVRDVVHKGPRRVATPGWWHAHLEADALGAGSSIANHNVAACGRCLANAGVRGHAATPVRVAAAPGRRAWPHVEVGHIVHPELLVDVRAALPPAVGEPCDRAQAKIAEVDVARRLRQEVGAERRVDDVVAERHSSRFPDLHSSIVTDAHDAAVEIGALAVHAHVEDADGRAVVHADLFVEAGEAEGAILGGDDLRAGLAVVQRAVRGGLVEVGAVEADVTIEHANLGAHLDLPPAVLLRDAEVAVRERLRQAQQADLDAVGANDGHHLGDDGLFSLAALIRGGSDHHRVVRLPVDAGDEHDLGCTRLGRGVEACPRGRRHARPWRVTVARERNSEGAIDWIVGRAACEAGSAAHQDPDGAQRHAGAVGQTSKGAVDGDALELGRVDVDDDVLVSVDSHIVARQWRGPIPRAWVRPHVHRAVVDHLKRRRVRRDGHLNKRPSVLNARVPPVVSAHRRVSDEEGTRPRHIVSVPLARRCGQEWPHRLIAIQDFLGWQADAE
eukprot:scaffold25307_cov109-Isochrysis_galbana.AAC.5